MECDKTECLKLLEEYKKNNSLTQNDNSTNYMFNIEKCKEYKTCINKIHERLMLSIY